MLSRRESGEIHVPCWRNHTIQRVALRRSQTSRHNFPTSIPEFCWESSAQNIELMGRDSVAKESVLWLMFLKGIILSPRPCDHTQFYGSFPKAVCRFLRKICFCLITKGGKSTVVMPLVSMSIYCCWQCKWCWQFHQFQQWWLSFVSFYL